MALTAARTELNVSLVGEDETIRMLEDAKKRMAELEAKTRTLTGATQAQTSAARAQEAATGGLNATLGRMGGAIAGPLEGIGKLKEGINKGIEVFGFLGMGVNAAISAFNFLSDAFDDSAEEAAKHAAQLEKTKAETDRLKASTDKLNASLASFQGIARAAGASLAAQRATIAELEGDVSLAAFEQAGAVIEQNTSRWRDYQDQARKASDEANVSLSEVQDAKAKIAEADAKIASQTKAAERADQDAKEAFFRWNTSSAKERAATARTEIKTLTEARQKEVERLSLAERSVEKGKQAVAVLEEQAAQEKRIVDLRLQKLSTEPVGVDTGKDKPKGAGGARRGVTEDEEEAMRMEQLLLRAEAEERGRVIQALYQEQKAREAVDRQMREAMETSRVELFKTLPELRQRLQTDLATLPVGATFDSVRKQLAEQLKAVDVQLADLKALAGLEDVDLLTAATDKQVESLTKLQEAYLGVSEARAKAREESEKLREQMERDNIAGFVSNFSEAMQGLGDIQGPVFEAVTQSLSGITAQMEKFKGGQQTLTQAVVGSGAAIAAAVGKQVDSVRVEAGIRAIFETAMGFANLANPAVAAGHFTAAATFGLVAGNVIPAAAKTGGSAGGQKAPAKADAASRESSMGDGGGAITNVYNLQTGIIDGQSTAMAFRRAEMTARNTGMASAGGW